MGTEGDVSLRPADAPPAREQADREKRGAALSSVLAAIGLTLMKLVVGILTGSLVSAVLGNDLPGLGTIYLSQSLQFKAPVYLGDTITATVELTAYREEKRIATFRTTCTNQDGALVLDGEAVVIAPKSE